jgi:excisionase family DNA binding protein
MRKRPIPAVPAPPVPPFPTLTPKRPPSPDDLLKPGQAAHLLHVSLNTIYRWFDNGTLPYVWVARRQRRVKRSDAEALIEQGKPKAPVPLPKRDVTPTRAYMDKQTNATLEEFGLGKYL